MAIINVLAEITTDSINYTEDAKKFADFTRDTYESDLNNIGARGHEVFVEAKIVENTRGGVSVSIENLDDEETMELEEEVEKALTPATEVWEDFCNK